MAATRMTCTIGRSIICSSRRLEPMAICPISSSRVVQAKRPAIPRMVKAHGSSRHQFSTSSRVRADTSKLIKDPNHPSEVYYHRLEDSNRYAITYLKQPPSSSHSPSIIAYVNYPESSKIPIYEYIYKTPDAVETNSAFISLLHDTMKKECVPQDGLIEYEAALRGSGWAHLNGEGTQVIFRFTHADATGIADQRHPLMPGRIATPENIIASVAFIDGELKPDSYEANGVYRVVTGEEGFMDLRPTWLMIVKKRCEEVN